MGLFLKIRWWKYIKRVVLCECGDFVNGDTFKDYIETKFNPSTPTIGHAKCGLVFNFVEGDIPRRYSSKKELKSLALKFADMNKFEYCITEIFLLEVDRLKSRGTMSDVEILIRASDNVAEKCSLWIGRRILRSRWWSNQRGSGIMSL